MKKTFFLSVLIITIALTACKKDAVDNTVTCADSVNRDMENFFNTLHSSSNYELYETMDLTTHEFTFTTNGNLQICGFGYKSQDPSLDYEIKLKDSINGTVIYQGNFSFSSTQFDYVDVPPISLSPGTYTLSRTVTNSNNLSDTVGPITRTSSSNNSPLFPVSTPDFDITSSNFYGMGGPVPDYGIPNIYFEYITP